MFKTSAILPLWLLISCCFGDSKQEGLCPTDGWISETDFHLDGDLTLPLKRFLESSWTTPWSQTSKAQISPNNGPDCNNNALLSSAPWSASMLSIQAFDSWYFFKQQKTKRSKARVLYYPNSTASFQILLRSGDISLNPGPAKCGSGKQSTGSKQRTSGNTHRPGHSVPASLKCDKCEKIIRKNQNSIACAVCFGQQHIKCTDLSVKYIDTIWRKKSINFVPIDKLASIRYR